jgi:drug/metabolite transporter (DMT)-like permease
VTTAGGSDPFGRPGPAPSAVSRPSARDVALMAVGVVAVSTSAPLIAATAAPALAIAFWRNALATVAISPFALLRHRRELVGLSRREWQLALGAGSLLTAHFATWVPSLSYTSVASSTALVASQPVWAAMIARATGHVVPRRAWLGMGIAFVGVLVITGVDLSLSARALVGDVLALAGAVFAAGYVTVGSRVRQTVSTTTYTFVCYGFCSVALLLVCLVGGQDLSGYSSSTWVKLLALTAGAQLLGHSVFNLVLQTTSPTVVSMAILFEMPGAALIAAAWLGQVPPAGVLPGALLLLAGVAVVVRSGGGVPAERVEPPPG